MTGFTRASKMTIYVEKSIQGVEKSIQGVDENKVRGP